MIKNQSMDLVVTGEVDESKLIRNSTAHENDAIILTKPLGTGIISTAIKQDKASNSIIDQAVSEHENLFKCFFIIYYE